MKAKDEFLPFFKIVLGTIASTTMILINSIPKKQRRPLPFPLSSSFFYEYRSQQQMRELMYEFPTCTAMTKNAHVTLHVLIVLPVRPSFHVHKLG